MVILVLAFPNYTYAQNKYEYLQQNKYDLVHGFTIPEKKISIVGFGAYHGSSKTEDAEIILVSSLINSHNLKYYIAETDLSIAHFLNEYLKSGDDLLLKDIVDHYGVRIPQERTLEVMEKWKRLKTINDSLPAKKKITVLGPDPIVTYKYTYKHLLSLISNTTKWETANRLKKTIETDTTDFSPYYDSFSKNELKDFVRDYNSNSKKYISFIKNIHEFNYLISLITTSFQDYNREEEIFKNYNSLYKIYNLKNETQYVRYGFSHLLKSDIKTFSPFFSRLVKSKLYPKQKIITILGYLNTSEVILKNIFDDNGNYIESVTDNKESTGDSKSSYYKGISELKKLKTSDLVLFKINSFTNRNPYKQTGCSDLIELVRNKSSNMDFSSLSTCDFIDYALLISNSKASRSIYSLDIEK